MGEAMGWLRSHLARNPALEAARLTGVPVLLAQGGRDVQLSVDDADFLRNALDKAGNKQVTVKNYPLRQLAKRQPGRLHGPTRRGFRDVPGGRRRLRPPGIRRAGQRARGHGAPFAVAA